MDSGVLFFRRLRANGSVDKENENGGGNDEAFHAIKIADGRGCGQANLPLFSSTPALCYNDEKSLEERP